MKQRATIIIIIIFSVSIFPQQEGDIVISEYSKDSQIPGVQVIELMVVNGPLDMRNWILTENSPRTDANALVNPYNEATMVFQNNETWNTLPSGTIIRFNVGDSAAIANAGLINDNIINQKENDFLIIQSYKAPEFLMNINTPIWEMSSTYGDNILLAKDDDGDSFNGYVNAIDAIYYADDADTAQTSNDPFGPTSATRIGPANIDNGYYFNTGDLRDLGNNDPANWRAGGSFLPIRYFSFGEPNKSDLDTARQDLGYYWGTLKSGGNIQISPGVDSTQAVITYQLASGWSLRTNDMYVVMTEGNDFGIPPNKDLSGLAANPVYGSLGSQWGANSYLVYSGDADSIIVSGLVNGYSNYNIRIWTVKDKFLYYEDTYSTLGDPPIAIEYDNNIIAGSYNLEQNYPNPFNPSTTISFTLPERSFTILKVYDILGKEVATLINEEMNQGKHAIHFNAANFASGVYLYTLQAGLKSFSKKMILMK